MADRPPPGYVQCNVCGEFNGSTDAKNLSWQGIQPKGPVSVSCLCSTASDACCPKGLYRFCIREQRLRPKEVLQETMLLRYQIVFNRI